MVYFRAISSVASLIEAPVTVRKGGTTINSYFRGQVSPDEELTIQSNTDSQIVSLLGVPNTSGPMTRVERRGSVARGWNLRLGEERDCFLCQTEGKDILSQLFSSFFALGYQSAQ